MPSTLATKLKNLKIEEVSGVDFGAHNMDGWLVQKRRGNTDALRKAQSMTDAEAWDVIVDRAASRAVAKTRIAEMLNSPVVPLTEIERLSAALVLKARHAERHETSGRFVPVSKPTPGPDADQFDGAPTNGIEPGTGNPAPEPTRPSPWVHLGATLFTGV